MKESCEGSPISSTWLSQCRNPAPTHDHRLDDGGHPLYDMILH